MLSRFTLKASLIFMTFSILANHNAFCEDNAEYNEVIMANQEHIEYNLEGTTKFETGDYESAIEDFKKALEYKEDYKTARFNLTLAYFNLKMYSEARESCLKMKELDPLVLETYYYLPFCSFYLGDYGVAKGQFEEAIGHFPDKTELYDHLARIYILEDDISKEESVYNKLLEVDPNNKKALFHRALIHSELQEFNEALDDYNTLLTLDQNHKIALANRGVIHINLGNDELGCKDMLMAKELGDNSPAIKELIPLHCE